MGKKEKGKPIPLIPPLRHPHLLATTEEWLATETMQEWIRLRTQDPPEMRPVLQFPETASGTRIEVKPHAVVDAGEHHEWLRLAREVDRRRPQRRWQAWRPLCP